MNTRLGVLIVCAVCACTAEPTDVEEVPIRETSALRVSFEGINDGTPSFDATIAAGERTLVLARNSSVAIRDKSGSLVAERAMHEFFAPVRTPQMNRLTDPHIIFDRESRRFFLVTADGIYDSAGCEPKGYCAAFILLAVSKTSEPRTLTEADWHFYIQDRTLEMTPTGTRRVGWWGDFDHLAAGPGVLVIGMVLADVGAKIRVLDKAGLVAGLPPTTWTDFPDLPGVPLPALAAGNPEQVFVYFRAEPGYGEERLLLGSVSGPASSPSLTLRRVRTDFRWPPQPLSYTAPQQGGSPIAVQTLNIQPVYAAGRLWIARTFVQNFGAGEVTAIRWSELDVAGWPDVRVVQDATFGEDGVWRFAPALVADAAGNFLMVYAQSSESQLASAYFTGRCGADLVGTLRSPLVLRAGIAPHEHIEGGRNRFTDYFGASLDPVDGSFWMMGMYAMGVGRSGTWVGNVPAC